MVIEEQEANFLCKRISYFASVISADNPLAKKYIAKAKEVESLLPTFGGITAVT